MPTRSAAWFPIHGLDLPEKVAALAVQGIVNRSGPELLVDSRFWNWPEADARWRSIYDTDHGFSFEPVESLPSAVERFRDRLKGIVVWDPAVPRSAWVAATLAGLEDLVPATPDLAERLGGLPVTEDLRGRFPDDLAAMEYAVETLAPRCAPRIGCSIAKLWSGMSIDSIDYAVMRRAVVFELAPEADDPRETALAHRMQDRIGPGAAVFGWAEPEERYAMLVSMHDNYILCSEAPNLSFHAAVPCDRTEWRQTARRDPSEFRLEPVHYVAFMTSEGDAPKIHSVLHGGAWFDEARGTVPINWGFQPRLLEIAPAMADYYYRSATVNDFFVCGASGAGYVYPNVVAEPEAFFRATGEWLRKSDIDVVECWLHFSRPVYESYARLSGAAAFTLPCGPLGPKFVDDDVPVFLRGSRLNYFDPKKGAEALAAAILEQTRTLEPPSFNTVFIVPDVGSPTAQGGYSPSQLREVMDRLPRDRFRVTLLDEMTRAAKEARRGASR